MRILVLKGLKQAIEAHTATAYLCLRRTIPSPCNFPPTHPGWDTSPPQHCSQWYVANFKKKFTNKDL